jgi:ABC-2 type transport system permease protein
MSKEAHYGLGRTKVRSPFGSLFRTQLKMAYGTKGLAEKLGLGKKDRYAYIYLALIGLAFVPLIGQLYSMARVMATQLIAIGQPGLAVVTAVLAGQFLVFFFGVSSVMSVLYYADDIPTLLAMPLLPRQIMMAKVFVAYVAEFFVALVITGPFLVALGVQIAVPEFWLYMVLIAAAIPAIPLALSLLATVLIMRVTKGSRKRDQFRVVLGLIFFVVIMGLNYLNSSMVARGPEETMRMLMERNGLLKVAAGYYPPLRWAAGALTSDTPLQRLGGMLLFFGVSFGALGGVGAFSQRWFLGGYTADVATSRGTEKKRRGLSSSLVFRVRRPSMAVALRDHYMLVRTPNFLLTVLVNLVVFPMITTLTAIAGQGGIPFLVGGATGFALDIMTLVIVAVHGLIVAGNQVASTCVSREGRAFWASKMIPVSPREQFKGKMGYNLLFALLQLVILLASCAALLKVDALHLALIAVLGALVSLPVTAICMINDLMSPKLGWENPHQAMKGNFGTMFAMVFSAAFLFPVGYAVKVMVSSGLALQVVYGVTGGFLLVAGLILMSVALSLAEKRYVVLEV